MTSQRAKRDFTYKRKHYPSTPFTEWLRDYCNKNRIPVVEMSLKAGLSRGTLNNFMCNPSRKPNPGTILKLSIYTGKPATEIAMLAGLPGYGAGVRMNADADPGLEKLAKVYRRLPVPMQHYLLRTAVALDEAVQAQMSHSPPEKKRG